MKPTIYFLDDNNDKRIPHGRQGKPKLIRRFINSVHETYPQNSTIFYPNELIHDVVCILDIDNVKIGMMSHENPIQTNNNLLNFFSDKGCDLIFCTSIRPLELNRAIANLVSGGMIQSVYLKSIWCESIEVNQLMDYEVSKLIEILQIHLDQHGKQAYKKSEDNLHQNRRVG